MVTELILIRFFVKNVHIDYYTELYTKFARIFGQNKVHAYKRANSSFSICAYRFSVSVSELLAYAIGFPSCKDTHPRPFCEASADMVTGSLGLLLL